MGARPRARFIVPLEKAHNRTFFDCGNEQLNRSGRNCRMIHDIDLFDRLDLAGCRCRNCLK